MLTGYSLLMVLGPLLGIVGAYLGQRATAQMQRWLNRGSVEASDARTLWEENRQLRSALQEENRQLRDEVKRLAARLQEVEGHQWAPPMGNQP